MESNELLNRYFDGEISKSELKELNELIANNSEIKNEFDKLKEIESILQSSYVKEKTSNEFSDNLMLKLIKPNKKYVEKFYFTLLGIFILLIAVIIMLSFGENSSIDISKYLSTEKIRTGYSIFIKFINNKDLIAIVSFIPFTVLLFIYFVQSNFKKFKKNVESFSIH